MQAAENLERAKGQASGYAEYSCNILSSFSLPKDGRLAAR